MKKGSLIFPLIFLSSFLIFYQSLNYYFFQDDWFVLNWIKTSSPISYLAFRTDVIYWRPITMPIFFALGNLFFKLNPLGYHLIAFAFHLINGILVFNLLKEFNVKGLYAKLGTFFYLTAALHFISLSWLSTTSYVIGPTFIFLSIFFFLKNKTLISFIFFLLSLASTELAVVILPLVLISHGVNVKNIKNLSLFFIAMAIYILIRVFIFPIPANGQYQINLGVANILNLIWYVLWSFNIPEKFSTVFFIWNFKQFPSLFIEFYKYLILPLVIFVSLFFSILISKIQIKLIAFSTAWFMIGLFPVILLPNHAYPLYLAISFFGILLLSVSVLQKINPNRILLLIICTVWLTSSYLTISFTRTNHWVTNEQSISHAYSSLTLKQVPNPQDGAVFKFKSASNTFAKIHKFTLIETEDNVRQSLNDQDAAKVLYSNQTLISIFLKEGATFNLPNKISTSYEIYPD